MKKLFTSIACVLIALQSEAQLSPVMPYSNYSVEDARSLAKGGTAKSKSFRSNLVSWVASCLKDTLVITESSIDYIYNHTSSEEVSLKDGEWDNSGLTKSDQISYFRGGKYEGFAHVMRIGSYKIVLTKQNCLNLTKVWEFRLKQDNPPPVLPPPVLPPPVVPDLPPPVYNPPVVIHDTVRTYYYTYTTVIEKGQTVCYQKTNVWDALAGLFRCVNVSIYNGGGQQYSNYPTYDPRTMPGGIGADPRGMPPGVGITPNGNNGGLGASSRSMPNGIYATDYMGNPRR